MEIDLIIILESTAEPFERCSLLWDLSDLSVSASLLVRAPGMGQDIGQWRPFRADSGAGYGLGVEPREHVKE